MGGCRCIFRECNVGTSRHPRMHFFRFPIKDRERLLKWVKMAKVPNLLQLPISMQKNKTVCARHFRDECFMNYMKDKLVANAVPTLERVKGGYVLDYANGDKPIICKLPEPVLPHMIAPPDFECPLHLEEIENDLEDIDVSNIRSRKRSKRTTSTTDSTNNCKKMKILNTEASESELDVADSSSTDGYISKFVEFVDYAEEQEQDQEKYKGINIGDCIVLENVAYADNAELQIIENTLIRTPGSELKITQVSKRSESTKTKRQNDQSSSDNDMQLEKERTKYSHYEEESAKQQMQLVEALQTASRDLEIKTLEYDTDTQELKTKIEELSVQNTELETKCENMSISNSLLKGRIKSLVDKYAILLEQNKHLEGQNLALQQMQQQQQVSTVSTSKEAAASVSALPAPSGFSKAQLFNGIKKYLSSTMVALVRMEMFGSAEREWKPDEKQASLDLLSMGENVYKYFTDEWRFRLPGLRQVLAWRNEAAAAPDDEEEDL